MNTDSLALFLHISGALGMAAAIALEALGLQQLRTATMPVQAGAALRIMGGTRRLGFASMLAAVLTGLYMTATGGGPTPWIYTTIGALVLLIGLTGANGPRMAAAGRALARETAPLSSSFHDMLNHPLISISLYTRIAIILGIVFLKTTKPDWAGSLLTMGIAIVLGAATALLQSRRAQAHAEASN
jgi:hypothetical protein